MTPSGWPAISRAPSTPTPTINPASMRKTRTSPSTSVRRGACARARGEDRRGSAGLISGTSAKVVTPRAGGLYFGGGLVPSMILKSDGSSQGPGVAGAGGRRRLRFRVRVGRGSGGRRCRLGGQRGLGGGGLGGGRLGQLAALQGDEDGLQHRLRVGASRRALLRAEILPGGEPLGIALAVGVAAVAAVGAGHRLLEHLGQLGLVLLDLQRLGGELPAHRGRVEAGRLGL